MRKIHALTCAAALMASPVWADLVPLSQEEFNQQVIGKTMHALSTINPGAKYVVQLQDGGRAVVSSSFNDVGTWRPYEAAGYCVLWNKLGPPERCFKVVKTDGKLATVDTAGKVTTTFEMR